MRKKVYVLLLFCLSFFMVCTTMKAYARAVFPPLEAAEANSFHDEPSFIVPESPFFVFTTDYIIPLSPSAGTVCKVPGVKCVDLGERWLQHYFGWDEEGASPSRKWESRPISGIDKDYYVLVLRRIVI